MSNTVQCQNPVLVGASGSKSVTTKLFVAAGAPDHDNCGEVLPPPQPLNPVEMGSEAPAVNVVLVTTIGAGLDGVAGAAKGRADDAGVAVAAGAGCVVSAAVEVVLPAADPEAGADPDGEQAAVTSAVPSAVTTAARCMMRLPKSPVRIAAYSPESVRYMRDPADWRPAPE
jgi:hypothetical protein